MLEDIRLHLPLPLGVARPSILPLAVANRMRRRINVPGFVNRPLDKARHRGTITTKMIHRLPQHLEIRTPNFEVSQPTPPSPMRETEILSIEESMGPDIPQPPQGLIDNVNGSLSLVFAIVEKTTHMC